jgi:hypothetical protein
MMSQHLDVMRRKQHAERVATFHTKRVMQMVRLLSEGVPKAADQDVRLFIEGGLQRHPPQSATKRQAALHEGGHYIAFEAEGLVAGLASIAGSQFGHGGWSGTADASIGRSSNDCRMAPTT